MRAAAAIEGAMGREEWSDEDLLLMVRAGETAAFGEIFDRYHAEVRRFARTLVPASEVDDLVSETFAKVLQALSRGRGPTDGPIRYLMVTARTTATSMRARNSRQAELASRPDPTRPDMDTLPPLRDDDLVAALATLSARRREALWWSEVEGLSPAEIGAHLGLSAAAASAMTYRARRSLKAAYQGGGSEDADAQGSST